jgi:hypothetical protein
MMQEVSNKHRTAPEAAMIDVITLLPDMIGIFVFLLEIDLFGIIQN